MKISIERIFTATIFALVPLSNLFIIFDIFKDKKFDYLDAWIIYTFAATLLIEMILLGYYLSI